MLNDKTNYLYILIYKQLSITKAYTQQSIVFSLNRSYLNIYQVIFNYQLVIIALYNEVSPYPKIKTQLTSKTLRIGRNFSENKENALSKF